MFTDYQYVVKLPSSLIVVICLYNLLEAFSWKCQPCITVCINRDLHCIRLQVPKRAFYYKGAIILTPKFSFYFF